ncbi:hypothetical protein RUM43_011826 [Polyplax serrata]|uniref:Uncharacterized protein n=1 Tax=Polyplax serrata TaxID=468196 RepID=A0AAN8RZG9_POLSC
MNFTYLLHSDIASRSHSITFDLIQPPVITVKGCIVRKIKKKNSYLEDSAASGNAQALNEGNLKFKVAGTGRGGCDDDDDDDNKVGDENESRMLEEVAKRLSVSSFPNALFLWKISPVQVKCNSDSFLFNRAFPIACVTVCPERVQQAK